METGAVDTAPVGTTLPVVAAGATVALVVLSLIVYLMTLLSLISLTKVF